jgi:hypothetical protein
LLACPQIIIADGVTIVAEKSELKKGKVTAALAARYSQYLQQLGDALQAEQSQLNLQVHPPSCRVSASASNACAATAPAGCARKTLRIR